MKYIKSMKITEETHTALKTWAAKHKTNMDGAISQLLENAGQ